MDVHRQIIDVKNKSFNIKLPKHFKDGKAEVIVLSIDEHSTSNAEVSNSKASDFIGCISKQKAQKMLDSINKSRDEWERDI